MGGDDGYEHVSGKKKAKKSAGAAGDEEVKSHYAPSTSIRVMCTHCLAPGPFNTKNKGWCCCPKTINICAKCGKVQ